MIAKQSNTNGESSKSGDIQLPPVTIVPETVIDAPDEILRLSKITRDFLQDLLIFLNEHIFPIVDICYLSIEIPSNNKPIRKITEPLLSDDNNSTQRIRNNLLRASSDKIRSKILVTIKAQDNKPPGIKFLDINLKNPDHLTTLGSILEKYTNKVKVTLEGYGINGAGEQLQLNLDKFLQEKQQKPSIENEPQSKREEIENMLMEEFPNTIAPFSPKKDQEIIEKFKDGSFSLSLLGETIYNNGYSIRGKSKNRCGLRYFDGESFFGISCFQKISPDNGKPKGQFFLHITNPRGPNVEKKINKTIKHLHDNGLIVNNIYIRHLLPYQKNIFEKLGGYREVSFFVAPWNLYCPREDEQYHHSEVRAEHILSIDAAEKKKENDRINERFLHQQKLRTETHEGRKHEGSLNAADSYITVKNINSKIYEEEDINRRNLTKNRRRFERCREFLKKTNLRVHIEEFNGINPDHESDYRSIIPPHFDSLDLKMGSTAEDYEGILQIQKLASIKTDKIHSFIAYIITSDGFKIPISFFATEEIAPKTVGVYSNITYRNNRILKHNLNPEDAEDFRKVISTYVQLRVFAELMEKGFKTFELGPSESDSLDTYKKYFGATIPKNSTTMLVK